MQNVTEPVKSSGFSDNAKKINNPSAKSMSKEANHTKNKSPAAFDLDAALINTGKDALPILNQQEFDKFDPLLSDWSCQLRTLWLINLINKNAKSVNLTDEDFKILGMYYILTCSKRDEFDQLYMSLWQYSDLKHRPNNWNLASNRNLVDAYGTAKKKLANFIIEDLKKMLETSSIANKSLLLKRFNNPTHTKFSEIPIRFVEFFAGYEAIVDLALEKDIAITILLTQYIKDQEKYKINGVTALYYRPIDGKFVLTEASSKADQPCIVVDAYSALVLNEVNQDPIKKVILTADFPAFVEYFKTLNLRDFILMVAAVHPQFPPQAFVLEENKHLPVINNFEDELSSKLNYYHTEGKNNEFGTKAYYSPDHGFFKQSIPLNIKHTYTSTFAKAVHSKQCAQEIIGKEYELKCPSP